MSYNVAVVAAAGGKSQSFRVQLHLAMFVFAAPGISRQPSRSGQAHAEIHEDLCTALTSATSSLSNAPLDVILICTLGNGKIP